MSNNFAGIAVLPYQGTVSRFPVKLPQGSRPIPNTVPPSVVPVKIDWNLYWQLAGNPSNVGVSINLQAASVQASILDRIASVKIDNTGSASPVYVIFEDTGDVVSAAPNTAVTFPCLTNLLNATIIAEGLQAGFIPTVKIFFYNSVLPPAVDTEINNAVALWKASPTITKGTTIFNKTFDTPALGDQIINQACGLFNVGNIVLLPPQPSGFYYITSCFLSGVNVHNSVTQVKQLRIADPATGANYWFFPFLVVTTVSYVPVLTATLYQGNGFNLKIDATHGLVYVNSEPTDFGNIVVTFTYTYQP